MGLMSAVKKNDFVEIKYTGFSDNRVFDSNIEADLKKISNEAKAHETIVVVGQGMVVSGLDKALEGKEVGKDYEVKLIAKDAFGERRKDLVRTIPLKMFRQKNMDPKPGMVFALDDNLAKILTISGARVITDFNNPLAGKEVSYKFKITRMVQDEKEKCKKLFESLLKFTPEFEIKDKVIVKGPKTFEIFIKAFNPKFKELIGKELQFELKEESKGNKVNSADDKKEE